MANKSKIAWTETTWNPVSGCSKVSEGCRNCYAERFWPRLSASHVGRYRGRKFTDVLCHEELLDQPLRWKRPRKIFVNSMSDLFHPDVPDVFIDRVFAVMGNVFCLMEEPHVFQVLTKRPERMRRYLDDPSTVCRVTLAMKAMGLNLHGENSPPVWPLPNVWLGVSVEDQETANERIPILLQTSASIRWISAEPLIGPIVLEDVRPPAGRIPDPVGMFRSIRQKGSPPGSLSRIDWVVVGGESGPKARSSKKEWFESLIAECASADVPIFVKQLGADYQEARNLQLRCRIGPVEIWRNGRIIYNDANGRNQKTNNWRKKQQREVKR